MKYFVWLLFLPGFLCHKNPLTIQPDPLITWEGSCVLIPCQIGHFGGADLKAITLLWYFQPYYDRNKSDFIGVLLYNSSAKFSNNQIRWKFAGDLRTKSCSLKNPQVRREDNGIYGARLVSARDNNFKWFLNATVHVAESPPNPKMDIPKDIREHEIRVTCSVPYYCPHNPLKLVFTGLERSRLSSQRPANSNTLIQTVVNFQVTWEDHGKNLVCKLQRPDGSEISRSTKQLDVNYAPKGVQLIPWNGTTIREGEILSLECAIQRSNPKVNKYYWYKDFQLINGQNHNRFIVNTKEDQHSGVYTCEATNSVGSKKSKELRIDVQYPPKEVKVNRPQEEIKEGQTIVLWCSSKGNPPITRYEWYKHPQTPAFRTGEQVQFDSIQLGNAGIYYCIARNSLGHAKSSHVTLNVLYAPKDVRLDIESPQRPIKMEDTVRLSCSFNHSNPNNSIWYTWYRDKLPLGKHEKQLIFPAKLEEAGDYTCEACNTVKCNSSPSVPVDIHFAPKEVKIVQEPRDPIYEGKHVKLRCQVAKANPKVSSYKWYKDGELQQLDSAAGELITSPVTSAHSGRYWCEASNSVATSRSQEIMLNVYYGPRNVFLSLERQVTVTEGMDAMLICTADANPPPHYFELYRADEKKLGKPDQILILRKVQLEDSGDYHCIAHNTFSRAKSQTLTLTVFYSSATKLKHGLTGFGILLSLVVMLGLLLFVLKTWKKRRGPGTAGTQRSGSFFVRKAKPEIPGRNRADERAANPLGFLNESAEEPVSYAMLRFPRCGSEEQDDYSRVNPPRLALDPTNEEVVYSVIKKPGLPAKGDSKHDYENVVARKEEELHYSSLVNLAPRPRPTCRDSDSESEESIQYAALKH